MSSQSLSNREHEALMKANKTSALKKCDDVVRAFAECSSGRTVSVAWACRGQHRALQDCLREHNSAEALDKAREDFLANNRK